MSKDKYWPIKISLSNLLDSLKREDEIIWCVSWHTVVLYTYSFFTIVTNLFLITGIHLDETLF